MKLKIFLILFAFFNISSIKSSCRDNGIKPQIEYNDEVYDKISKQYPYLDDLLKSKNINKNDIDEIIIEEEFKAIIIKIKNSIPPYIIDFENESEPKIDLHRCFNNLTDKDFVKMEDIYNQAKEEFSNFDELLKSKNIRKSDICCIKILDGEFELKIYEKVGSYMFYFTDEEKYKAKIANITYQHNSI